MLCHLGGMAVMSLYSVDKPFVLTFSEPKCALFYFWNQYSIIVRLEIVHYNGSQLFYVYRIAVLSLVLYCYTSFGGSCFYHHRNRLPESCLRRILVSHTMHWKIGGLRQTNIYFGPMGLLHMLRKCWTYGPPYVMKVIIVLLVICLLEKLPTSIVDLFLFIKMISLFFDFSVSITIACNF